MPLLLFVVLLLGLVLAVSPAGRRALLEGPTAKRIALWVGLAVAAFVLVRAGLGWLAAAGGGLLALANRARPLLHAVARARRGKAAPSDALPSMTADEARAVLGVGRDATRAEVLDRYRHLMKRLHPDQGGSTSLASRVNAAKQRLLG